MKMSLESKIYIGFGLALLILSIIGITSYLSMNWLVETGAWKEQTSLVLAKFETLLSELKDVGGAGYVITGDERYLEPYYKVIKQIDQDVEALRQLTAADPQLQRHFDTLEPLIRRRLAIAKQLIETRRNEGFEAAVRLVQTDEGKRTMDAIRQEIAQIEAEQAAKLQQQTEGEQASVRQATIIISMGSLLAVIIVVIAIFVIKHDLTQRKRLETTLHESEALFRATFEEASIGIGLTNIQGGILASNLALQKMLGYSFTELQQMTYAEFTHTDDVNESKRLFQELINGECRSYQMVKRYLCKDGQVIWGHLTTSLVQDNEGRPLFVVGMVEDITERKQAEETLRQTNLVIENSSAVLFRWRYAPEEGWPVEFVSQNITQFGYTPEDFLAVNLPYKSILPPEDTERIDREIEAYLASGIDRFQLEYRFITKTGQARWVDERTVVERDAQGQITHLQGLVIDITDRKQFEKALAKERNLMRTLLDNLPDLIYVKDTESRLLLVNNASLRNGTMTMAEIIGKTDFELHSPELAAQYYADDQAVIHSGQPLFDREEPNTSTGQLRWFSTTKAPLRDTQGQIIGLVGMSRDITERKRMEEALRHSEERFALAVQGANDGIWDRDIVNDIVYRSPRLLELYGYNPDELDPNFEQFVSSIHPDDRERVIAAIEAHLVDRVPYDMEHRVRTKSGEYRWFRNRGQAVWDETGRPVRMVGAATDITERKQMETALAQERNLMRTLIDNLPDYVYFKDTESRFMLGNPALARLMGAATPEALVGKTDFDFYPETLARQFYADEQVVIQSGQALVVEEPVIDQLTQEMRWLSTTKVPLRDSQDKIIGLVGTGRDITESRQVGELLAQRAVQLMLINDISSKIASVLDLDSVLDQAAHLVHHTFGYHHVALFLLDNDVARLKAIAGSYTTYFPANHTQARSQGIIGWVATHGDKVVANDVSQEPRYISKIADKTVTRAELCLPIRVAGQTVGVLDIQSPHLNDFGENDIILMEILVAQIAVAIENARLYQAAQLELAERKQMEAVLAEERNLLRTVINATPDWIFLKDLNHCYRLVNQSFASTIGLAPEDFIGKNDLEIGFSEDLVKGNPAQGIPGFWSGDREVIETSEAKFIPEETIVLKGQPRAQSTVKVPLRDPAGNVVGVLGFVHDITELKRTQDELRQAKDAAESATRVKSEFLANMSHEIRTPLNAVIGMTSLLLDTPLSPEQQDFAETIRNSGDTLLTLINDILDFSKIEAGRLELEKQAFDVRECIEGALDLVALKAAEKKLELAYTIGESTPSALVGDLTRLRQILVNLLNNAVKFTDGGEIVLSVMARVLKRKAYEGQADAAPLYEVHFAVRDSGIGIPPDRMDRLFRSFSQVDASTTRKYGGTGLGLSISKRLSELMGGTMWVESEGSPGQGSTFHFTILAEAGPSQTRIYLQGRQPELTGKQLLIVDDNATNRLILAHQSLGWGMRPRAAASAAEALAWIRRGDHFDLAVLDMQMPGMNGLGLAAEIRKQPTTQTLPLVMLTSLGWRDMSEGASQVEFAAYLTKPIKSSHLYNTLVGIFRGQPVKVKLDAARISPVDPHLGQRHALRILLAEDNVVNQKVALHMLQSLGYLADVAANGLEVLQALTRQPYDVVLMDVQMPEMDGLEATQHIHQQWPAGSRPCIIAMTANALQGDRERCLVAGMDDYISKPVRREELARALSQVHPQPDPSEAALSSQPVSQMNGEPSKNGFELDKNSQVLDARVLAELQQLLGEQAPQMIAELSALFLESAVALLEEMRAALQAQDGKRLYRAAHTLKPGSHHLGALRLAAMCETLETMGHTDQLEGALAEFAALEAEFNRVKLALEAKIKE